MAIPPTKVDIDCIIDFPVFIPMLAVSKEEIDQGVMQLLDLLSDPTADPISLLSERLVRAEIHLARVYALLSNTTQLSFTIRECPCLTTSHDTKSE